MHHTHIGATTCHALSAAVIGICTTYMYYTVIFCHILRSQTFSFALIRSIMDKMTEVDS